MCMRKVSFYKCQDPISQWTCRSSGSDYLAVEHNVCIFMFQNVAVEQIALFSGVRMGEVDSQANRLTRPDQHSVFPAKICYHSSGVIYPKACDLSRTIGSIHHLKLESMKVHRMRHTACFIANFPQFCRVLADDNGIFLRHKGQTIDEPAHQRPIFLHGEDERAGCCLLDIYRFDGRKRGSKYTIITH